MHSPIPRPQPRLRSASPFLAAVAAVLLAACGDPGAEAPAEMPPPEVGVATLVPERITLTRALPGRTNALLVAEVRPQVSGIVRERLFEEGSYVEAGQPLYQLDDATYRAAFQSAEASVTRAEAAEKIARLNAERAAELRKTNAISQQEYQNLLAIEQQAAADVAVAKAQLENARVRLDYARIEAPISGRVGKSTVTAGALVTADQADVLTTVQQLDPSYVDVTQSASEILRLRRQLSANALELASEIPVAILFDDGGRYAHEGTLTFEDVAVDPTTGSVAMRIVVPNPESLLLPGMYVRAEVGNAVLDDALLVPQRGITHDPKGQATAMVLTDGDVVEQRVVELRETVGDSWLVESGLSAGDRVVVSGLQKIQPGQTVQVASAASAE
ncbi:MAG TPA: efflux RND transporter periplasmic adaptor subunit [Woeseiaceae bacterium]|nr:efflux RND transporter periplasmic adaptor subunit [Woeseiaceae bacterium]